MRIALLIDHLGCGGAQRQLVLLARLLQRSGLDVSVVTYYPQDFFLAELEESGIPRHVVNSKTRVGRIVCIRKHLRNAAPDIVISFLDTPNLLAEFSTLPVRSHRLIVSERSYDVAGRTIKCLLRLQMHRLADAVITNSHAQKDFIHEHAPFLASRTHVITNCVDLNKFAPTPSSANRDGDNLLLLGNFAWYKNPVNFGLAIRQVMTVLGNRKLNVRWYGDNFFSEGMPTARSSEYLRLRAILEDAGLRDRVELHPPTSDVLRQFRWATAVCVPSIIEGFPNVIGEAMACGLPVIASRTGDNPRLVCNSVNGYLFDPHSPQDMATAIHQFLDQPANGKQQMGEASRKRAVDILSPATFAERYLMLIRDVCEGRNILPSAVA